MKGQFCNAFSNPFFILKASQKDNIVKVIELYEDSLFDSEEDEENLKKAQNILTNNLLRLNAEVHWFGDLEFIDINRLLCDENVESLPTNLSELGMLNFIVHHALIIKNIDLFDKWLAIWDRLSKENIYREILQSRKNNQIFTVDQEQVNKALDDLMVAQIAHLNDKQNDNFVLQQWFKLKRNEEITNLRSDSPLYLIRKEQIIEDSTNLSKEIDLINDLLLSAHQKIEQSTLVESGFEPVIDDIKNALDDYFDVKIANYNNRETFEAFDEYIYTDLFVTFLDSFKLVDELSSQDQIFSQLKFDRLVIDYLKEKERKIYDAKLHPEADAEFEENIFINELMLINKQYYMTQILKVNYPEIFSEIMTYSDLEELIKDKSEYIKIETEQQSVKMIHNVFPSIIPILEKDEHIRVCIYHQLLQFANADKNDTVIESLNRIRIIASISCLLKEYPINNQLVDIDFTHYIKIMERRIFSHYWLGENEQEFAIMAYMLKSSMPEYMSKSAIFSMIELEVQSTNNAKGLMWLFLVFLFFIILITSYNY